MGKLRGYLTKFQTCGRGVYDPRSEEAWRLYLQETKQAARRLSTLEAGLKFEPWIKESDIARFFREGLFATAAPRSFQQKLDRQAISLVLGDLAKVPLERNKYAPFHLINATNVLIYAKNIGQQLAFYNLANVLAPKGFLVIDDYNVIMPWMESLFKKQYHGWLTMEALGNEYGLQIYGQPIVDGDHTTYVLQKMVYA